MIAGAAETSTSPSSYAMIRMLGAHFQQSANKHPSASQSPNCYPPNATATSPISSERMFQAIAGFPYASSGSGNGNIVITGPQCPHCGKTYSNASNLRQHVRNVHVLIDKSMWHSCQTCGKKLKTKHYLINHQLQAHGIHQRGIGGPSSSSNDDLMDTVDDDDNVHNQTI